MGDPPTADEWTCPDCGSEDPHNALTLPHDPTLADEVEVDVTCGGVYITPVDGDAGFRFDFDEFDQIIEHYATANKRGGDAGDE